MNYETWEGLTVKEIQQKAHEAATGLATRYSDSPEHFVPAYDKVFNFVFKKLLMPATEDTPSWVVRLANYFTDVSEIDEIETINGKSGAADPLNEAEYVELRIRFKRNGSGKVDYSGERRD